MADQDIVGLSIPIVTSEVSGASPYIVLHYRQQGANEGANTNFAEALALGASVRDILTEDRATDIYGPDITVGPIDAFGVTEPTVGVLVPAAAAGGSTSGDYVSPRSAMVATKRTALRGRSFRGRTYFPWVLEGAQDNGVISPTYLATYQAVCDDLESIAAVSGTSAAQQLVVYSPTMSANQSAPVATPVVQMVAQNRLGSIRGRWSVN